VTLQVKILNLKKRFKSLALTNFSSYSFGYSRQQRPTNLPISITSFPTKLDSSSRCQFHQHIPSCFFVWKCFFAAFPHLQFCFVISCQKNIIAKAAHIMLVKLTTAGIQRLQVHVNSQSVLCIDNNPSTTTTVITTSSFPTISTRCPLSTSSRLIRPE